MSDFNEQDAVDQCDLTGYDSGAEEESSNLPNAAAPISQLDLFRLARVSLSTIPPEELAAPAEIPLLSAALGLMPQSWPPLQPTSHPADPVESKVTVPSTPPAEISNASANPISSTPSSDDPSASPSSRPPQPSMHVLNTFSGGPVLVLPTSPSASTLRPLASLAPRMMLGGSLANLTATATSSSVPAPTSPTKPVGESAPSMPSVLHPATSASTVSATADTVSMSSASAFSSPASSPLREKRRRVREEIVSSEESYVRSLEFVSTLVVSAVRQRPEQFGLSPGEASALFAGWETLTGLHRHWLEALRATEQEPQLEDTEEDPMAALFIKEGDFLKMTASYLAGYGTSLAILAGHRGNARLQQLLGVLRSRGGLDIFSYLIMPVQRLPRYTLLLRELLKHTPEGDPQYAVRAAALSKAESLAQHADQAATAADSLGRTVKLAMNLCGAPDGLQLLLPHRRLVRQGTLYRASWHLSLKQLGTAVKPRAVFLFSDLLLFLKPLQCDQFAFRGAVSLARSTVQLAPLSASAPSFRPPSSASSPAPSSQSLGFDLVDGSRHMQLFAPSVSEKEAWSSDILDCINQQRQQHKRSFQLGRSLSEQAGNLPSGSTAAPGLGWLSDALAPVLTLLHGGLAASAPLHPLPASSPSPSSPKAQLSSLGATTGSRSPSSRTRAASGATGGPSPAPAVSALERGSMGILLSAPGPGLLRTVQQPAVMLRQRSAGSFSGHGTAERPLNTACPSPSKSHAAATSLDFETDTVLVSPPAQAMPDI